MAQVIARSEPYRVSRLDLGRVGALAYIRMFWWALIGIPICGIVLFVVMNDQISHAFATVFLLWPLTIPGRVILTTWRPKTKLFTETTATVADDGIFLEGGSEIATRVPWRWIKRIWPCLDYWVLQNSPLKFALVKRTSFSIDQRAEVEEFFRSKGLTKTSPK